MSKLKLILLGQFECLLSSGERISLAMRKAEVLLAYLALAPGIRHPRERLINLLWSDRGEEQARNSLRQCLSAIRKSLGDSADLILQIDRTTVSLKPGLIDVDALEFEQLAMEGDFESLSTAAGLYRGEFLEGISIRDAASQDWLDGERSRFKRQFVEILINLGETQLVSHDFGAAIRSTERLVEQDPLGESGWRLLMRSYAQNGDRSHALQAFKRCQKSIRDELDVDPEAATIELRDQIATGGGKFEHTSKKTTLSTDTPTATGPGIEKVSGDSESSTDHSIAVLPFDNLSGDPEQEYFSDGITDSIILNLSMFPGLQVKSRNSSFAFKQQIKSLGEISQELNVDYLVEGSIRKSRDRIRITVQLIETDNGNQVWGKRYDAGMEDLFELEEELSRTIAATVTGQIDSDLQRIAIAKGAAGQESYDLLLSGIYHAYRFNRQDTVIAIEQLNQCLAQDPENVRAHAMLYTCHGMDYLERWTQDYRASFKLAEKHIRRALALGSEFGLVQVLFAEYLIFSGDFETSVKHLDKALEINPNDPDALTTKALNFVVQGEFENGLQTAERACGLDPYHPWAEWELAGSQFLCGHYEAALETISKFRTEPGFTHIYAVASYIKLGKIELARQALQKFLQDCRENMLSMPQTLDEWIDYTRDTYAFSDPQINQDIMDCLVQAGLDESITERSSSATENIHNIAVLPFDNLSGDPDQEYFSDGITESIILNLTLFPELNVKSRNSSFAFKQQIKNIGEVSKELDVSYVVEGSVRKSAERVRITVQLVEASTGIQVWGKRYDAEMENLFDLEEELSRTIAATVTGQIESDLQRIAIGKGAAGQESYDLLLSGIYHARKFTRTDTVVAIDKLNQCLAQDPDNLRAHAQLCICHMMNWMERWLEDYEPSFEQAAEHAHKALALDPDVGYVQIAYAEYLIFNRELSKAATCIDNALQINPNNADALAMKALILELQGDYEGALEIAELGYQLDPHHPWIEWDIAESQYWCGLYEEALETISKSRNAPGFIRSYIVAANIKLGRKEQAQQALSTFLQECRETMLAMPQSSDEWLRYSMDNAPFADSDNNRDLIDCLVQAGLEDNLPAPASPNQSDEHSIAVLPFDNLSGDPEQEYFSDGITDSIILNLSRFPGLQVKSRNSSFAFKQQIKNLGEISRELNVDYIVEGSIRKSVDRIRITVQLIEAESGNQVWGKRYDSEIENLFDLEEELSRSIAATVTGQIESDLQRIAITGSATDQQAYDLLLSGNYHLDLGDRDNVAIAIEAFNQCLSKDPDNARVHANLFYAHDLNVMDHWTEDVAQSRELATGHIHKAVSLAPDLGLVQVAYANYLIYNHQFDKAEYQLKCALDTNPNDTEAIAMLAVSLCIQGKAEAALEQAELALKLDPYHAWVKWIKAESQFFCGRFEDCLATIADTGNAPGFIQIYNVAANTKLGRLDNAKTALEYFLRFCRDTMLSMPDSIDKWREYYRVNAPFIDPARNQEIIDCLVQAGLCDDIVDDNDKMPSLLVLPFSNLSGDPEQEYFSDGISESIIVNLSSFNGLNVKSRHTSFAFKNSAKGIDEIAEELAVQYIVEGSIRKFGDKIRITVQLGETESGNQLWGERFESELEDLFALEEILVKNITGSLGGRIGKEIVSVSMHKPAKDLKSYDYLMRGLHHIQQFSSKENSIAREHFEKCLEHDPDNSEANALLAGTYVTELYENWTADRSESKRLMVVHAEKSLQLEPNDALAHAFMAEILLFLRDFDRASHHVERAMELNPNLPDCYSMKCSYLVSVRRHDEALENADISIQIDPHHFYMCWNAGEVYRTCGQYERAVRTFRSMSHMPPSVRAQIAASLAGLGKIDEARSEMLSYLEAARRDMPYVPASRDEWRSFWYEYMPYQYEEDSESFFQLLLKAGLFSDSIDSQGDIPSIAVLPFENMSGDPEQEYFSDGITTSIILGLGLFHGISIKSQKSSFSFKRSKLSSVEIARALEADYLVEGSIRKSAAKVRVSVQLIESESGTQIWGKQYDQELEDILELEQELSQAIAATISGRIGHEIQRSAVRKPAKDLKSYDYLMRGMHHFGKFTAEDMVVARELIQKCIDIDPENALAHTNLAVAYDVELLENWTSDRKLAQSQATTHFEIALQLDPEDALTHAYLAEHLIFLGDFNKAEFHADRAIELNPTASEGYVGKADLLGYSRQADKALVYADQSLQLDPHSVGAGWVAGDVYRNAGQYKKAIKIFRSISHPPPSISGLIAVCFADLGLIDEARTEMQLYQKLAKQQMPKYPESTEEWRRIWGQSAHYLYREDFNTFFNQLLAAGLCDEFVVSDDDLPSIAVLPFENMSDDPEQEFFSAGITTDIIATLSKFNHMRIVARHSTTQYKNRQASIAEIARQQNVRYILEGSVRKSGGRIRVNAELIDSHNEKICWSERYDRDLDDLFAAQDELTKKIALAMKVHLDDGDMALHRSTGTTSIKAWQLTLAAIDLQDTYIRENILEARSMAKQAIDLDPDYPYAWVALGWTFWQEVYSGWSDSPENSLAEAQIAQQKALDLVPLYSEAWSLGGLIHLMKHEPEEALADCRKAVELEPGNAEIQALMAFCLIYVGDYENAQLHDQNMLKLCPVLPNWYYLIGGEIAQIQGNFEEAVNYFQQGIDVEPNSPLCRFYLIDVMMELGNESRARELADEIRALDNKVAGKGLVRTVSQDKALRARFQANLEKFDLY